MVSVDCYSAHLVSIGIKSKDSILLKESVICGHHVYKEVYAGSTHTYYNSRWMILSGEGCGLQTSCYLQVRNTCVALLRLTSG